MKTFTFQNHPNNRDDETYFDNIGICTFHHFTPWQMVSPCTSWGLCCSLRSGKDIFSRSPKARSLQKVQRHIFEPHSHILSLRYERQPILSWSRGQCSAADNQFTADGCWFGKTSSELCKCWKGRYVDNYRSVDKKPCQRSSNLTYIIVTGEEEIATGKIMFYKGEAMVSVALFLLVLHHKNKPYARHYK